MWEGKCIECFWQVSQSSNGVTTCCWIQLNYGKTPSTIFYSIHFLEVQILDSVCSSWSVYTVLGSDQGCLSTSSPILYNRVLLVAEKQGKQTETSNQDLSPRPSPPPQKKGKQTKYFFLKKSKIILHLILANDSCWKLNILNLL